MDWKDREFSQRLEKLSIDTTQMISKINGRKQFHEIVDIIMTTNSEEEIVKKLQELMNR